MRCHAERPRPARRSRDGLLSRSVGSEASPTTDDEFPVYSCIRLFQLIQRVGG
jgi:hypothetical protein